MYFLIILFFLIGMSHVTLTGTYFTQFYKKNKNAMVFFMSLCGKALTRHNAKLYTIVGGWSSRTHIYIYPEMMNRKSC